MIEFNPDGSIKLPTGMAREKKDFEPHAPRQMRAHPQGSGLKVGAEEMHAPHTRV